MAKRPAPTKATLFDTQEQLKFASEGCELLHQKRDVLVMELMNVVAGFSDVEKKLREQLGTTLDNFLPAYLQMGRDCLTRCFSGQQGELELDVSQRGVMGIELPQLGIAAGGDIADPGLLYTNAALDLAVKGLRSVLDTLTEYIEIVASVWRLTTEIEKTQKRINALENIFIPEAKATIHWIKTVLEENEREEFFRRKRLASTVRE